MVTSALGLVVSPCEVCSDCRNKSYRTWTLVKVGGLCMKQFVCSLNILEINFSVC